MNTNRTSQEFCGVVYYYTNEEIQIIEKCSSVLDMISHIVHAIKTDPGENDNKIYACIYSPINKAIWCSEEFIHKDDIDDNDLKSMSTLFNLTYGFRGSVSRISDNEYSFVLKVRRRPCTIIFRLNDQSVEIVFIDEYIGSKISTWITK